MGQYRKLVGVLWVTDGTVYHLRGDPWLLVSDPWVPMGDP